MFYGHKHNTGRSTLSRTLGPVVGFQSPTKGVNDRQVQQLMIIA